MPGARGCSSNSSQEQSACPADLCRGKSRLIRRGKLERIQQINADVRSTMTSIVSLSSISNELGVSSS